MGERGSGSGKGKERKKREWIITFLGGVIPWQPFKNTERSIFLSHCGFCSLSLPRTVTPIFPSLSHYSSIDQ